MVDPQTSLLLSTAGLFIEILGAWSVYASMPRWDDRFSGDMGEYFKQVRTGFRNLGLFFTLGLLLQYIANL